MGMIIRDSAIVEDYWTLVEATDSRDLAADSIVPLAVWLKLRDAAQQGARLGVWLASDERVEEIEGDLPRLSVVALHFPVFNDGRHYSTASLLRRRYGFAGEIRAFGDVRRDQVEQLHRCGFNAFVPRGDDTPERLLAGLKLFTHSYQSSADRPLPLFRMRQS